MTSDKQTYTPGPWLLHDQVDEIWTDDSDGMLGNIFITEVNGENSLAEDRANAKLMAAAPDLLKALDQILDDLSASTMEFPRYGICRVAWDQAIAAILKAKGQDK